MRDPDFTLTAGSPATRKGRPPAYEYASPLATSANAARPKPSISSTGS